MVLHYGFNLISFMTNLIDYFFLYSVTIKLSLSSYSSSLPTLFTNLKFHIFQLEKKSTYFNWIVLLAEVEIFLCSGNMEI